MNRTFILILVSGICGGSVYPLIKIANSYGIPKFGYIFWESCLITLFLVGVSIWNKDREFIRKSDFKYYLFCALTNIIIPQTLFFLIAPHLPASVMGVVIVLTPLLVYFSLVTFFKEQLNIGKGIGVLVGFIGAVFLFLPDISKTVEFDWRWLLFSFFLPADYAINRIFVTKLRPSSSTSHSLAIGLFGFVAIISCLLMIASSQIYNPFTDLNYGDLSLLSHAILMTIFYIIFFVLAREGAVQNSLSFYVAPVTTLLWGYLFFDELLSWLFVLATVLVFSGLYLLNRDW